MLSWHLCLINKTSSACLCYHFNKKSKETVLVGTTKNLTNKRKKELNKKQNKTSILRLCKQIE